MSCPDGQVASTRAEIGDAANVMVLSPSMELPDCSGCERLLSASDLDGADLLLVSLTESPDDRLDTLRARLGEFEPARLGLVAAGDPARSAAAGSPEGFNSTAGNRTVTMESISSPGDLTGLGMKVSSIVSDWEGDGNDVVVCFHSLTTILQYAEVEQVFRFLHVLTGRFDAVDGFAHYHVDPGAHDEQDVNTLKALFDAIFEYQDGTWDLQTR